jgi:predicted ATPase
VDYEVIWVFGKSEYFLRRGWTLILLEVLLICPSGRSAGAFATGRWAAHQRLCQDATSLVRLFLLCSGVVSEVRGGGGRMSSKRNRTINMPAPYLQRVWLDPTRIEDRKAYPFCLPFLRDDFELTLDQPVTIIVGENGTGKSTLLEGIAVLAGFDEAGGGRGYRPVDHSNAVETMGGELSNALRASWLPRITNGWFFRAESFFSVARYLDASARDVGARPPDFLSYSHGEGFLRFFEERCQRQGIFIFDEPESALSPARQMEFLKLMRRMEESTIRAGAGDRRADRPLQGHAGVLRGSVGVCRSCHGGIGRRVGSLTALATSDMIR